MSDEKARAQAKPEQRPITEDAFSLTDMYPNAAALFEHQPATIAEISATSFVALDANVLLWPYEFNSASLAEVDRVYGELSEQKRLVVPGQAAREFYKHRSRKLASLSENIDGAIARAGKAIFQNSIPILQDDDDYKAARSLAVTMIASSKELIKKLDAVKVRLQSDVGSDPISSIYRKHFTSAVIDFDFTQNDRAAIAREAERRGRLRIAPGFKDQSKEDGGIGDLVIWKTVLQEAERRKGNCLFVTNEEKSDWWVKSGGAFQPRPELLDEYRRASEGGSIHLLPLSELLSLFAAKPQIVQDVQDLEDALRQREPEIQVKLDQWLNRRPISEIVSRLETIHALRNQYADRLGSLNQQIDDVEARDSPSLPVGLQRQLAFTRERLNNEKIMLLRELEACASEVSAANTELASYSDDTSLAPLTRHWISRRSHIDGKAI